MIEKTSNASWSPRAFEVMKLGQELYCFFINYTQPDGGLPSREKLNQEMNRLGQSFTDMLPQALGEVHDTISKLIDEKEARKAQKVAARTASS